MILDLIIEESQVSWDNKGNIVVIKKDKICDAKYIAEENVIVIIFENKDSLYPCMCSYTLSGHENFIFRSTDELGVIRFTVQKGIDISVVGWVKENGVYTDYYFSVDAQSGSMNQYGRAY